MALTRLPTLHSTPRHGAALAILAPLSPRGANLQDAIIIADPDYLLEAMPYYIRNPTYLMRERRFGHVVRFTGKARLSIDLDAILATARTLRTESGKPILILLRLRLDPSDSQIYHEMFNWKLLTTPRTGSRISGFNAISCAICARALTDESFDVFLLDQSDGARNVRPQCGEYLCGPSL